jgi:Zn finger protein HypA/HybF involved in hydrogenase expression
MHEFGIVENIISHVLPQLEGAHVKHVSRIYFRRGSAFSEDALRHAFQAATVGTPLQDAELMIETLELDYICECGYEQVITSDDLEGSMFTCPLCGNVHEVEESHDLELVEVIAETE